MSRSGIQLSEEQAGIIARELMGRERISRRLLHKIARQHFPHLQLGGKLDKIARELYEDRCEDPAVDQLIRQDVCEELDHVLQKTLRFPRIRVEKAIKEGSAVVLRRNAGDGKQYTYAETTEYHPLGTRGVVVKCNISQADVRIDGETHYFDLKELAPFISLEERERLLADRPDVMDAVRETHTVDFLLDITAQVEDAVRETREYAEFLDRRLEANRYREIASIVLVNKMSSLSQRLYTRFNERVDSIASRKELDSLLEDMMPALRRSIRRWWGRMLESKKESGDYYDDIASNSTCMLADIFSMDTLLYPPPVRDADGLEAYLKRLEQVVAGMEGLGSSKFSYGDIVETEGSEYVVRNVMRKEGGLSYMLGHHLPGTVTSVFYDTGDMRPVEWGRISRLKGKLGSRRKVASELVRRAEAEARKTIETTLMRQKLTVYDNLPEAEALKMISGRPFDASAVMSHYLESAEEEFARYSNMRRMKAREALERLRSMAGVPEGAKDRKVARGMVKAALGKSVCRCFRPELDEMFKQAFISGLQGYGVLGRRLPRVMYMVNGGRLGRFFARRKSDERRDVAEYARTCGLNLRAFREGRTYVYTPDPAQEIGADETRLDPYAIGEEFLQDLLEAAPEFATNNRQREAVALTARIIGEREIPDKNEFMAALSKPKRAFFSALHEAMERKVVPRATYSRVFNTYDRADIRNIVSQRRMSELLENLSDEGMYPAYRDVAVSEILDIVASAGKAHMGTHEAFNTFWERYMPEKYDLDSYVSHTLRPDHCRLTVTRDPELIGRARRAAKSCLGRSDVKAFAEDAGTIHIISHGPDRPMGYVRMFLGSSSSGEPLLAVDTIEVPLKAFERYDSVKAMGLAAVQLGLDVGVKYVLGEDARVKYGPRQAFGNKTMKARLRKRGANSFNVRFFKHGIYMGNNNNNENRYRSGDRYCYSFPYRMDGTWKGECYMLLRNWRVRE